jgi:pimeloyl-ACP methyl ester carboxylesterase
VFSFDRRGRGGSAYGAAYSIDREVADVLTVVGLCPPPFAPVGHSFEAVVCLLVAAPASTSIDKFVLYEPPLGTAPAGRDLPGELDDLVAARDLDEAVRTFARGAGIASVELRAIEAQRPVWSALRDAVPTASREMVRPIEPLQHRLGSTSCPTPCAMKSCSACSAAVSENIAGWSRKVR